MKMLWIVILFTKSFGCSLGESPTVRAVGLLLSETKKPQATNSGASKLYVRLAGFEPTTFS